MRNFNNDNKFGGSRGGRRDGGRDGGRGRGGFGSRDNQMHDAVCDNCGDNCKVPFRPTSGKPIYCSNCFEKNGNSRDDFKPRRDNRSHDRSFSARDNAPKADFTKQFQELNDKLDLILTKLSTKEETVKSEKVETKESAPKAAKKATKAKKAKKAKTEVKETKTEKDSE